MGQHLEARDSALLAAGENWMSSAACHSADPELFFPVSDFGRSQDQVAQAKAVCAGCQVRRECLSFALRTRQAHGIWGGMTEQERHTAARTGEAEGATAVVPHSRVASAVLPGLAAPRYGTPFR
jgi:WhiB family redox-sensing transcriptional regulator